MTAALRDDCFANDGRLITAGEGLARLKAAAAPVTGVETVDLIAASGRILARDVKAARDTPGFSNSAVDGYAFAHRDLAGERPTRLEVVGRAAAGHPLERALRAGEAARILTGAMVPEGADAIAMQEDCAVEGSRVTIPPGLKPGANLRRAGEDLAAGDIALRAGTLLRPQELAAAASVGRATLDVRRRLRVALFSTGDELREPGQPLPAGGVYDANRAMLRACLEGLGAQVADLGILADEREAVARALRAAALEHDVIVTSGGASMGDEDHVVAVARAGGRLDFWRLAVKPGRPLALGRLGEAVFVGLPGNPVAALVCLTRLVRPVLLRLAGRDWVEPPIARVPALFAFAKKPGRREYLRGWLEPQSETVWAAQKFPSEGSGLISSLRAARGLIELEEDLTEVRPGDLVSYLSFAELGLAA